MQNDKLLPCPFCGGKPFVYTTGNASCGYYVEIICEDCGCRTDRAYEEVASEVWNTRKPMERMIKQLEEKSDFFGGEPMGSLQKAYYCKGITKAIEIVKGGVENEN